MTRNRTTDCNKGQQRLGDSTNSAALRNAMQCAIQMIRPASQKNQSASRHGRLDIREPEREREKNQ